MSKQDVVIEGGPDVTEAQGMGPATQGAPAAQPAASPQAATVTIGGQTIQVDPAVAELFRRELNARDGRHGAQLQQLQRRLEEVEAELGDDGESDDDDDPTGVPSPGKPDPNLLLTDPDAYQKQQDRWTQYQIGQAGNILEERRALEQEERDLETQRASEWDSVTKRFFEKYPQYRGKAEGVVDLVWKKRFDELAPYEIEPGLDKLAELVAEELVELRQIGERSEQPPRLESSRRRPTPETRADEDEAGGEDFSINKWARARREQIDLSNLRNTTTQKQREQLAGVLGLMRET